MTRVAICNAAIILAAFECHFYNCAKCSLNISTFVLQNLARVWVRVRVRVCVCVCVCVAYI